MSNNYNLISDSNISPLKGFLINIDNQNNVEVAPFGQVIQELYNKKNKFEEQAIFWLSPKAVIPTFSDAAQLKEVNHNDCLEEVKKFSEALIALSQKKKTVYLVSWEMQDIDNNYGLLDWRPNLGLKYLLMKMNLYLAELLSVSENIYILDSYRWFQNSIPVLPKIKYATKVEYSNDVFKKAAKNIYSISRTIRGLNKKIIILDLDNTLWGGVVGDVGKESLKLGGHDFLGEAFKDFQSKLLALSNKGVQLSIVSKNDENVALDAIETHSEMVLKKENFSGWKINWNNKATNIEDLLVEMNLGHTSAVFIDDNPVERDLIKKKLPEVFVPDWPNDPTQYSKTLLELDCFDTATLSNEDRIRSKMYNDETKRKSIKNNKDSLDEWLNSLKTEVVIDTLNTDNLNRVAQLFNKTNQLNLSTRRLLAKEILKWVNEKNKTRVIYVFSLKDRIGNLGIIGVLSAKLIEDIVYLVDFVMSCRAMGRRVEDVMYWQLMTYGKEVNAKIIKAEIIPTKKNRPTSDIFDNSYFKKTKKHNYEAKIEENFKKPNIIKIITKYNLK